MTTDNTHPADTHEFEASNLHPLICNRCGYAEPMHRNSRVGLSA